ncbi:MAG: Ni/Fe-hydrogenase cytochrome b subunit [candidate division Zixibacteria bacterium]|nr:Ni/Fe-hydrogenase cytochrome b subunit [candidate division Zixibacteria bacterium]
MSHDIAVPVKAKFFTKGTKVVFGIMVAGMLAYAYRLLFGIGAATNLDDQWPWGIWIAIDVASGVALAAGGFTTAALADVFHKDKFHVITRPALITAMLGYTFVVIGLLADLGRYYNVWHPMLPSMWQGNSVLFEVGMCVMVYLTVLYVEFMPILVERFRGKVNLPGMLAKLNSLSERLLTLIDKTFVRFVSLFIIAGCVLSCLHQSSLGTLMVIAPTKMHPLWYTPISPLLFLLSAIAVGFPMVIFESVLASRSFKLKPETNVLSSLAAYTPFLLGTYFAFKIGDITIREVWPFALEGSVQSLMWWIEILLGVLAPVILLAMPKVRASITGLFTAACLVVGGVALNRINVFLVAYKPLYSTNTYFPAITEIMVTVGLICALVLVYRFIVINFPVIAAHPIEQPAMTVGPNLSPVAAKRNK